MNLPAIVKPYLDRLHDALVVQAAALETQAAALEAHAAMLRVDTERFICELGLATPAPPPQPSCPHRHIISTGEGPMCSACGVVMGARDSGGLPHAGRG